jgi:hypothetical protein
MNFASVDAVLDDWAQTHQLHVHKMDRNVEVRSVEQRFGTHDGFQIWIEPPNADDLMGFTFGISGKADAGKTFWCRWFNCGNI